MSFLREHQLSIMLIMNGMLGILAFMTLTGKMLSHKRKSILALMELSAMLLLFADRYAYIYRGDPGEFGFLMVRCCNAMVFFMQLLIPFLVTQYMRDLYKNEGGLSKPPVQFVVCDVLFVIGTILLVVSQFTGLYYTFDEQNNYQRASGFFICYIIPVLIVFLQEFILLKYRYLLNRRLVLSLAASIILPTISSVVQYFTYGISLINITMVFVVIVFFINALYNLSESVEEARIREIHFYKEAQKKEYALFEQTTEALANAIDAKDRYTRGHSARVAVYSRRIAKEAGLSDEECSQVYFAALLHDVGKIGIRDGIITKEGSLTDEEFEEIKRHSDLGSQILSSIRQSPYLSVGAHYHHERYDGKGYPDGLAGEEIPVIARIIAVADAYDAMTSKRSYRDSLPQKKVREEIANGKGTQFDPRFAEIMLDLIDHDSEYQMRDYKKETPWII